MNEQKFISNGVSAIRSKKDQELVGLKTRGRQNPLDNNSAKVSILKKNEELKCMKSIVEQWFMQRSYGGDIY